MAPFLAMGGRKNEPEGSGRSRLAPVKLAQGPSVSRHHLPSIRHPPSELTASVNEKIVHNGACRRSQDEQMGGRVGMGREGGRHGKW